MILLSCSLEGERGYVIKNFEKDLTLWLDASDINGDGSSPAHLSSITFWTDKSGHGNDANGIASSPQYNSSSLNGLGTISFSEAQWFDVDLSGGVNSPVTLFIVCRFGYVIQPGANDDYLFSMGSNVANSHLSVGRFRSPGGNTDAYFVDTGGGATYYGPLLTGNQWLVITQISDDSTPYHSMRLNGVTQTVDNFAAAISTNGEIGIGYYRAGGTRHFLGGIAEILLYDRKLSVSELVATENYLAIKWGL